LMGIQVTQDTGEAFENLQVFKKYGLFLMVSIILLVLFFVYLIHYSYIKSHRSFGSGSEGDRKWKLPRRYARCECIHGSRDEIGLLVQTFQNMLLNLRTI